MRLNKLRILWPPFSSFLFPDAQQTHLCYDRAYNVPALAGITHNRTALTEGRSSNKPALKGRVSHGCSC